MKKIRFSQILSRLSENLGNSHLAILRLQDSFKDGKITAAAARRAFLPLWAAFVIDRDRFNKVLGAYEKIFDNKEWYFADVNNSIYEWFMA